jgi:hypothetical protein
LRAAHQHVGGFYTALHRLSVNAMRRNIWPGNFSDTTSFWRRALSQNAITITQWGEPIGWPAPRHKSSIRKFPSAHLRD